MGLYTINRPRVWVGPVIVADPGPFEADDDEVAILVESGLLTPAGTMTEEVPEVHTEDSE